jgi:hypothetical protein
MPTELPSQATPQTQYDYKASLIGSAHQFDLTEKGLSWKVSGRSGVWAYGDIAAVCLSYRPTSMQAHRFRADVWHESGARIKIMSTSWQTVSLMLPQDDGYRAFVTELHARMQAAGSKATLVGGLSRPFYAAALIFVALLAVAMVGLFVRALATGEHAGALFLVGFALLFYWQIGGFIRRNRPVAYGYDRLPDVLLP